ncbi:Ca-activated chloride channel family protein [Saccharothrix ecbatanensis]|uniref:Ca-activated chloride channel family protein n=1 Tax=Saccharothrix ecbatanensis TaxID=1105145 RepID=A0A7W9HGN1_9PSEU|nr:substrate-binding and VWA domain-containing protein [Saccharothrix ecbatanensis]MBB5801889.1 Ca-activated chloride channel family protein [Saccharothrix ecbatanensis]
MRRHRTRRLLTAALTTAALTACTATAPDPAPQSTASLSGPPTTLRVLAGSELADLRPVLQQAEQATGVKVELEFTGSLDGAQKVAEGKADGVHDAVWFSSTRYLRTIPEGRSRLGSEAQVMTSPVVLGLREPVARELGWDRAPVTWADVAAAVDRGALTFAMTDPAASNTGFSALVAVATALDGGGRVLDLDAITRVSAPLSRLFTGHRITAGSSDWLGDAFVRRATGADPGEPVDALITYEASLLSLNRSGKLAERLVPVYPQDGVVSADYPLTVLSGASTEARDAHRRLGEYLRTPEAQRAITEQTNRRPAVPGVPLPPDVPANLAEIPFPDNRAVIDALLDAYADRLRRPARTVYVLDVSGSMEGERIGQLKQALSGLTGADESLAGRFCRFRGREEVILLPFNQAPGTPLTFTVDEAAPQTTLTSIGAAVQGLAAGGDTAVYDSLIRSYELLGDTRDRFASIVLMTDGENRQGVGLPEYRTFLGGRSDAVPVFPILFGEAAEGAMREVAQATGGAVWDARHEPLDRAFCQIRGYQ